MINLNAGKTDSCYRWRITFSYRWEKLLSAVCARNSQQLVQLQQEAKVILECLTYWEYWDSAIITGHSLHDYLISTSTSDYTDGIIGSD